MASPIHRSRQRVRNKVSRLLSRLITPDPLCWARVTLQQGRSVSELRAMLEPVAWRCQLMSPGEREAKVDSASGNHGVQLAERYCCASSSDDSVALHGSHYSYSTSSRWDAVVILVARLWDVSTRILVANSLARFGYIVRGGRRSRFGSGGPTESDPPEPARGGLLGGWSWGTQDGAPRGVSPGCPGPRPVAVFLGI